MRSVLIIESEEGRKRLEELATSHGLDQARLRELLSAVERHSGMLRRRGLFQQFDAILDEAAK